MDLCLTSSPWVEVHVKAVPSPLYYLRLRSNLLQRLLGHQELSGVILGDTEYRISLYADDILLCITNPEGSIPFLLSSVNLECFRVQN